MNTNFTNNATHTKKSKQENVLWRTLKKNTIALFGIVFLALIIPLVIIEPLLPLPDANDIDLLHIFAGPSREHLLGTDENGRDVFVRLVQGGRVSLAVGFTTAFLTVILGTLLGSIAGFMGGIVDQIIMRFTDGMMAIPVFFIVLAVVALWGSTLPVLVTVLALTRWMGVARLVRSEVIRYKGTEFITAAKSIGASNLRLITHHLLPQAMSSIIVATSIGIGSVMLVEAALSFLGLGIQPPTSSWGNMLSNSQFYIWTAPHLAIYPGLLILFSVLSFNSLGDILRDLLDPRYRPKG